jgi:mono/diheme cytochrome c family protein
MKYLNAIILTGIAALGFSAAAATVDWSKLPPAATGTGVTFDKDIQPIFKTSCVRCHGAERPRAQLRLDTLDGVLKGTKQGSILTAGDSASSLLVKAVSQLDPETAMPPKPRARRGPGGPQGTNAPAMPPREGGDHGPGDRPPGGPPGTNAPGQRPRNFGPPAKPLTPEQVGLVRAWIDQGAK